MSFEEIEISRQSCRGDCEARRKRKLLILLLGFRPRIRPLGGFYYITPSWPVLINFCLRVILSSDLCLWLVTLSCRLVRHPLN
jgi:hypothetical protein